MALIKLTQAEEEWHSKVEFDQGKIDWPDFINQGPIATKLMVSLETRRAIPDVRLQYWSDPKYQIGRLKTSHRGLFEKEGSFGTQIYSHPNFLEYLRYFIRGAQLESRVKTEFENVVGNPLDVSSGDMRKIERHARKLVGTYKLYDQHEEFYRHSLDLGLGFYNAKAIRETVRGIRQNR